METLALPHWPFEPVANPWVRPAPFPPPRCPPRARLSPLPPDLHSAVTLASPPLTATAAQINNLSREPEPPRPPRERDSPTRCPGSGTPRGCPSRSGWRRWCRSPRRCWTSRCCTCGGSLCHESGQPAARCGLRASTPHWDRLPPPGPAPSPPPRGPGQWASTSLGLAPSRPPQAQPTRNEAGRNRFIRKAGALGPGRLVRLRIGSSRLLTCGLLPGGQPTATPRDRRRQAEAGEQPPAPRES